MFDFEKKSIYTFVASGQINLGIIAELLKNVPVLLKRLEF